MRRTGVNATHKIPRQSRRSSPHVRRSGTTSESRRRLLRRRTLPRSRWLHSSPRPNRLRSPGCRRSDRPPRCTWNRRCTPLACLRTRVHSATLPTHSCTSPLAYRDGYWL